MLRFTILLVACTAVAAGCGGSPTAPGGDPTPKLSRTRFLAFGDSITAGEVTVPVGSGLVTGAGVTAGSIFKQVVVPTASYPAVLHGQLASRYAPQSSSILVVNSGVPGESILSGALRFPDAFDANQPEVVLLMEGVNGLPIIGPDLSTELIQSMAQTAKLRSARVFVGSMLPTIAGRQRSQDAAELEIYNGKLQAMAVQEGVVYVDLYDTLRAEPASLIGVDGLHPTEAGYRRIAELFFEAIRNTLEEK